MRHYPTRVRLCHRLGARAENGEHVRVDGVYESAGDNEIVYADVLDGEFVHRGGWRLRCYLEYELWSFVHRSEWNSLREYPTLLRDRHYA